MSFSINDRIEVALVFNAFNMEMINTWTYKIGTVPSPVITAANLGEAWWNHVKATYRGIIPIGAGSVFRSVKVKSLESSTGDYGEFDIPSGESVGTRTNPSQGEFLPPFVSAGVRLVVGTRVTRPGQKRFCLLTEGDQIQGILQSTLFNPLTTLMNVMVANMTLGAPAALIELLPVIVRKSTQGLAINDQAVTGFIVKPQVTTQNTRKYGRGS